MDLTTFTDAFPRPGETIFGNAFHLGFGGKGANQAVAASLCGARVSMIARVGDDLFGPAYIDNLQGRGVDTTYVHLTSGVSTGVAPIFVDSAGQNRILVVKGANDQLSPTDIDAAEAVLREADCVVLQLEIPLPTVYHTLRLARKLGIRSILNPAPGQPLDLAELANADYVIPNETEAEALSGLPAGSLDEARVCARSLGARGVRGLIVTLGANGALFSDRHVSPIALARSTPPAPVTPSSAPSPPSWPGETRRPRPSARPTSTPRSRPSASGRSRRSLRERSSRRYGSHEPSHVSRGCGRRRRASPRSGPAPPGHALSHRPQRYSFNRPLTAGTMKLDDLIDYCADHDIDGVDLTGYYFPGYPAVPPDEFLYALKKRAYLNGVTINGTGVRNDFTRIDAPARRKLGAGFIRVFTGPRAPEGQSFDQVLEWMIPAFKECAEYGRQNGVVIGLQHHDDFLKTPDQTIRVVKAVNSEWFHVVLDVGSLRQGDPYAEIEKLLPYACTWPIKEQVWHGEKPAPIDLAKVRAILDRGGYRGFLPIEKVKKAMA